MTRSVGCPVPTGPVSFVAVMEGRFQDVVGGSVSRADVIPVGGVFIAVVGILRVGEVLRGSLVTG